MQIRSVVTHKHEQHDCPVIKRIKACRVCAIRALCVHSANKHSSSDYYWDQQDHTHTHTSKHANETGSQSTHSRYRLYTTNTQKHSIPLPTKKHSSALLWPLYSQIKTFHSLCHSLCFMFLSPFSFSHLPPSPNHSIQSITLKKCMWCISKPR